MINALLADCATHLASALQWAQNLVGRTRSGRFDGYLKLFDAWKNRSLEEAWGEGHGQALVSALFESTELIDIAKLDPTYFEADAEAIRKLRAALGGRPYRHNYRSTEHDPNRDAAFELSVAASLVNYQMFGGFSTTGGDLIMQDGELRRPVECKRLTSPSGLYEQVRRARHRIDFDCRKHGLAPGVVAIDVTRAMNAKLLPLVANSTESMKERFSQEMKSFVLGNLRQIQKPEHARASILGVMVRSMGTGFAGSLGNIHRYWEWSFVFLHGDKTAETEQFVRIVKNFGPGPAINIATGRIY